MKTFREFINEAVKTSKVKKFTDGAKLLKYVSENEFVSSGVQVEGAPAIIEFLGHKLNIDEGGTKGTHYWNRFSEPDDELEIDVCYNKQTRKQNIKIVMNPPMDAYNWIYFSDDGGVIADYHMQNVVKKFKKLDKKLIDEYIEIENKARE